MGQAGHTEHDVDRREKVEWPQGLAERIRGALPGHDPTQARLQHTVVESAVQEDFECAVCLLWRRRGVGALLLEITVNLTAQNNMSPRAIINTKLLRTFTFSDRSVGAMLYIT